MLVWKIKVNTYKSAITNNFQELLLLSHSKSFKIEIGQ